MVLKSIEFQTSIHQQKKKKEISNVNLILLPDNAIFLNKNVKKAIKKKKIRFLPIPSLAIPI